MAVDRSCSAVGDAMVVGEDQALARHEAGRAAAGQPHRRRADLVEPRLVGRPAIVRLHPARRERRRRSTCLRRRAPWRVAGQAVVANRIAARARRDINRLLEYRRRTLHEKRPGATEARRAFRYRDVARCLSRRVHLHPHLHHALAPGGALVGGDAAVAVGIDHVEMLERGPGRLG